MPSPWSGCVPWGMWNDSGDSPGHRQPDGKRRAAGLGIESDLAFVLHDDVLDEADESR